MSAGREYVFVLLDAVMFTVGCVSSLVLFGPFTSFISAGVSFLLGGVIACLPLAVVRLVWGRLIPCTSGR
ncbi:hypothetical protein [Tahibacter amnicola]|uniref:YrhK-like protein n=1 Tax=Tahibacter amnicola TaxID=2976241 RepID=A0ABY6BDP4_9GAMM|nr:hypothetical protein [Tahibacter amnicola]UXI67869.1 hypothetical protein N4264_24580 [Tahibacter amnicola]